MLAGFACSSALGSLLGLFTLLTLSSGVDSALPVPNCTGKEACVPSTTSLGPLVINAAKGTGHRDGVCGCEGEPDNEGCVETTASGTL